MDTSRITMNWQAQASDRTIQPVRGATRGGVAVLVMPPPPLRSGVGLT
jgi:hypothetical protein